MYAFTRFLRPIILFLLSDFRFQEAQIEIIFGNFLIQLTLRSLSRFHESICQLLIKRRKRKSPKFSLKNFLTKQLNTID
jgi:hypothetical protein